MGSHWKIKKSLCLAPQPLYKVIYQLSLQTLMQQGLCTRFIVSPTWASEAATSPALWKFFYSEPKCALEHAMLAFPNYGQCLRSTGFFSLECLPQAGSTIVSPRRHPAGGEGAHHTRQAAGGGEEAHRGGRIPHHTTPIPYRFLPYHTLPHPATPYRNLPYHTLP